FLADAERTKQEIALVPSEEVEKVVRLIVSTPPDIAERYARRLRRSQSSRPERSLARVARSGKAFQRKPANLVTWCDFGHEICQNFADHRRKLESVTGTGRGNYHVWMVGQAVDDEIAVGRHSVKTARGRSQASIRVGEMIDKRCADHILVGDRDRPVAGLGVDRFVAVMMLGNLDES